MTPQLSILMSVRNEERYLPATLDSLRRQSLAGWELVVIDDGSDDATPAILAAAAAADPRIRLFRRPHTTLVDALNFGLGQCRTELVARLDGDDVCHPRRLELQFAALRNNPELGLVASRVRHFPRPHLSDGMLHYETWQNDLLDHDAIIRDLFVESPFTNPSVLFRKQPVLEVGAYHETGWPEDYDLWLRLAKAGCRFGRLPETLLYWRDSPKRLTRTDAACTLQAFRRCKAHHLRRGYLADCSEVTLWGAGAEGKAWRLALQEFGITVSRWIEIDPRKIGQTIHGAPVVDLDALAPGQGKLLVTIGAKGARQQVRDWADQRSLAEGVDYLCVT